MNLNRRNNDDLLLLKSSIGFGTAFKATLGFYAAQFVATLAGLIVIAGVIIIISFIFR